LIYTLNKISVPIFFNWRNLHPPGMGQKPLLVSSLIY